MKNSTMCLLSALGGALVGAAVAMLITPQSGKELRGKIRNAFNHASGDKQCNCGDEACDCDKE